MSRRRKLDNRPVRSRLPHVRRFERSPPRSKELCHDGARRQALPLPRHSDVRAGGALDIAVSFIGAASCGTRFEQRYSCSLERSNVSRTLRWVLARALAHGARRSRELLADLFVAERGREDGKLGGELLDVALRRVVARWCTAVVVD